LVNDDSCVVVTIIVIFIAGFGELVILVLELCSVALFGVVTRVAKRASKLAVLLAISL